MSLLFSFFGRVGRGGWWLGVLVGLLLMVAAAALAYFLIGPPIAGFHADGTPLGLGDQPGPTDKVVVNAGSMAVLGVGYLLGLWVSVATTVKRLHDRGKSGWWYLLMLVLSVIIVGSIWMLVECGILEGQNGPNKYGSDPRVPVAA